jgi:hypothetical protein
MANFVYDSAREKFLNGEISWKNDDIRVALLQNDLYVGDDGAKETDTSLADIPSNTILRISHSLQNKISTSGAAYSGPVVVSNVPGAAGTRITSVVVFKQGNSPQQSFLIAHIDTDQPNTVTQDVTIQWNSTGNKIFKL